MATETISRIPVGARVFWNMRPGLKIPGVISGHLADDVYLFTSDYGNETRVKGSDISEAFIVAGHVL